LLLLLRVAELGAGKKKTCYFADAFGGFVAATAVIELLLCSSTAVKNTVVFFYC
jgi:hypothetical protein